MCGKLTGRHSPSIEFDKKGDIIENDYEREKKTYTYSKDSLNLLLKEKDSAGKITRYVYEQNSDRLQAKYVSFNEEIVLREFYFYDKNHALNKKIVDDGRHESYDDLFCATERHITNYSPRKKAPIGLPEEEEEWIEDLFTHQMILIKRLKNEYSRCGKLEKQKVFDADNHLVYTLEWDWDLHGNLISETNAMGIKTTREYDKATDNLDKEEMADVKIKNTYDFVNRLIEKKEIHPDAEFVTNHRYDTLGNCKSTTNFYGHSTHYHYDEFGRIVQIERPEVVHEGVLVTPIEKKSYNIAGHLISSTDANGNETRYKMNIRGQPTKIFYPDGTSEEMLYSPEGWLMQKTARNGMITRYERDFMGRVKNEEIRAEEVKQTQYVYNSFHLINETDSEGNITHYAYDFAGRVKEVVKNKSKTQYFYDSLGRLNEIREFYGNGADEYRVTLRSYDLLDRIKEEKL